MKEYVNTILLVVAVALLAALVLKPKPQVGRFVPFRTDSTRVALDTKTGLACNTWHFNPYNRQIPLCEDLAQR